MIFHSGGSLVWKKAGCVEQVGLAKSCGAADRAEIPMCGSAGMGSGLSGGLCGTGRLCEGLRCCGLGEGTRRRTKQKQEGRIWTE